MKHLGPTLLIGALLFIGCSPSQPIDKVSQTPRSTNTTELPKEDSTKIKAGDWSKLDKTMGRTEVWSILGTPERAQDSLQGEVKVETWYYPNGQVSFTGLKVSSWSTNRTN